MSDVCYDVLHYDLDLRYDGGAVAGHRRDRDDPRARHPVALALRPGLRRRSAVTVNGGPARFSRDGDELVITPRRPLLKGLPFVVRVEHYTAHPLPPNPDVLLSTAFFFTPDGSASAGQLDSAHVFMPANHYPRDKASFTIRFDVPAGETALANGVLIYKSTSRGRTR